uniref:Uncharacterized protein n=1 Tax=Populus trichocarpa TaxID=3694 RepID=A0A2K1ZM54_POPTR
MASRDDSPFCDPATFWDRQYHSIPRNIVEQPSSSSKRHVLAQSPLPVAMSQWEQLLNLQLLHHHVQQSHLLSQSTIPFCLPHLYGYQVPGVNAPGVPRPFTPIGTIDGSWHFAVVGGGGTSLKNHPQVSNLGYQFVCPYPFFPGPWDTSSWWQLCSPCTYTVPGLCGYVRSQPPNMPGSATSLLESFQRGIIRTPEKLSQKHQQLWDAQITDYKSRIMKLQAEIPPVKQAVEDPIAHVAESAVSRKASKRGRPKKLAASVDAPPSLDKPQLQAQARKSEPCKVQPEARAHIFEEVVLNKNKKNSKMLPDSNVSMEVDGGELNAFISQSSSPTNAGSTNVCSWP